MGKVMILGFSLLTTRMKNNSTTILHNTLVLQSLNLGITSPAVCDDQECRSQLSAHYSTCSATVTVSSHVFVRKSASLRIVVALQAS